MFFKIDHTTRYDYSAPVQLGEHVLRFLPLRFHGQQPGRCRLEIKPEPVRCIDDIDCWGNRLQRLWFEGETDHLEIVARLEIETFDAALPMPAQTYCFPLDYADEHATLAPYLVPMEAPEKLHAFMQPLLAGAAGDALAFLDALNRAVHAFYHRGLRLQGQAYTPAQTIELGDGVCRDLAVLFMAASRQAGIAARFASGYQKGDGTREQRYLHAWAEVYLPGIGWRGFDPTHAERVADDHVVVAAAPEADAVTPVEGGFGYYGDPVETLLNVEVRMTVTVEQ